MLLHELVISRVVDNLVTNSGSTAAVQANSFILKTLFLSNGNFALSSSLIIRPSSV